MFSELLPLLHALPRAALVAFPLIAAAIALASSIFYKLLLSPLKSVPGPLLAQFTRLWELDQVRKGRSHKVYQELHAKHGPVVRVGPNRYSFSRPEDVKQIYALGTKFTKTEFYDPSSSPDKTNIFSVRDIAEHSDRRRRVASLYSMSTMVAYESAVDEMTTVLMEKLDKFSRESKALSVPEFMQFYAFDVISSITLGESFGMMKREDDVGGLRELIKSAMVYQGHVGIVPEVHPLIFRILGLLAGGAPIKFLDGLIEKKIKAYESVTFGTKRDPRAEPFLAKLMDLESANRITQLHVWDSCGSNIGAGSDTTGISLGAAIWYLFKNREKLAKLRAEIDVGEATGEVSDPVTFAETQKMPYLQAVVKETLRLHPAVGTILARTVPPGGIELAGRYFPQGTHVGANAWVLHYDPETYGPDVESFRPERWLEAEHQELRNSMFFAFGAGSRACIGKNISLLEMYKVIPQIVRNFEFTFVENNQFDEYCAWFVWPEYKCKIIRRSEAGNSHSQQQRSADIS